MKVKVVCEKDVPVSFWSGGSSKEYCIFPLTASYKKRDFCFRMSMAKSDSDEKAVYSFLPGVIRYLVMLEGIAHVFHEGHYDVLMKPYEVIDVFDGAWESFGLGKAVDFNLMVANGTHGKMSIIDKEDSVFLSGNCCECNGFYNFVGLFCGGDFAEFDFGDHELVTLVKGDLLFLEDFLPDEQFILKKLAGKLIRMDVCCHL